MQHSTYFFVLLTLFLRAIVSTLGFGAHAGIQQRLNYICRAVSRMNLGQFACGIAAKFCLLLCKVNEIAEER